ncbi:inositol monophosphatase family protein [Thiothrix eikelboomii]|uniref:Inositol-1-monophosphatase n=1 Tax=Thiothrix eikelboomii TaxID=92487 RepID=A0A1T4WM98_9GAMM|nr:inositol monophosphatase family protein [Thiothrix eikelboomii]SKA78490.1 myo-inositol-1(or 4)-monophosphatase [Thiothrix eikelboomii]
MHPMLNIATRTARQAGDLIRRYVGDLDKVRIQLKDANDFVSEVDKQAEREIIQALRRAYPDHAILGEESGQHGDETAEYQWVIDPLDGTTNFLYGLPHFAVSIGLKQRGRLLLGVVYDPLRDELFAAARGEGATLNNRRIRVSSRPSLENALLATGVPFRANQNLDLYLDTLRVLVPGTAGVRRFGSAALDLAWVACGRYDGFWEFGLQAWDLAAGALIIQEAGGLVGDLHGGSEHLTNGNLLAANPKVFKEMLQRLHPVLK